MRIEERFMTCRISAFDQSRWHYFLFEKKRSSETMHQGWTNYFVKGGRYTGRFDRQAETTIKRPH
jgi:hypothetical protein